MTRADKRLVAALTILGDQIPPIIDEVLAGQLDRNERRELALVFLTLAAELDPGILAPGEIPPLSAMADNGGADGAR